MGAWSNTLPITGRSQLRAGECPREKEKVVVQAVQTVSNCRQRLRGARLTPAIGRGRRLRCFRGALGLARDRRPDFGNVMIQHRTVRLLVAGASAGSIGRDGRESLH